MSSGRMRHNAVLTAALVVKASSATAQSCRQTAAWRVDSTHLLDTALRLIKGVRPFRGARLPSETYNGIFHEPS